ncbi:MULTISPECIES: FAD-binding protein [unclassified Lactobacillus]|uniref:FAD-binding protein n=1 Tax=unclassified Lactobacillus TaxID=2620435 RepID=UPI00226A9ECD|nr:MULTISPECIES: FAD-binding protein [unclassified Lactobacillus]MCX8721886.1 FAD-binding protein [Lactobacillus sp. B4010]MCX8731677.1 FAD-binding protein [Lactobacillus sp. B4015]MCX8734049.1 FAD-binding protein [Lactobacillus sp. B4012]
MKHEYKAKYDVIVLGFGGAGATAARFAADKGAKVLLVDSAPYGHEGGNTRYCIQLVGTADNYDEMLKYYKQLSEPMDEDEKLQAVYVKGMANMRSYLKKYLGVNPVSVRHDKLDTSKYAFPLKKMLEEFPEFDGANTFDFSLVHEGIADSALWKILRKKVQNRNNKIDVWLNSRAKHLIKDTEDGTIIGAIIQRNGQDISVAATKGVVLTLGGYENSREMAQAYLNSQYLAPFGTLYNKGDGIRLSIEAGAQLWHMWNYESAGLIPGLSFYTKEGSRARLVFGNPQFSHGSIMTVAEDGTRYIKENGSNRHGHVYNHGRWDVPNYHTNIHLIFDQAQYEQIMALPKPFEGYDETLVKADSITELAKQINVPADNLKRTVKDFNYFVEQGRDYQFGRDVKTMRKFREGPYYAIKMINTVLNTQGGPKRNSKAQILDGENKPIRHLYGAGELGGVCVNNYQTACNIAECLIFGKIAGENIAAEKDKEIDASQEMNGQNDLLNHGENIILNNNQFLGTSHAGMGDEIKVCVTTDGNKIKDIEIIEQNESEDIGKKALKVIPQEIIKANSTQVDVVTGATRTSHAIQDAVSKALKNKH